MRPEMISLPRKSWYDRYLSLSREQNHPDYVIRPRGFQGFCGLRLHIQVGYLRQKLSLKPLFTRFLRKIN